MVNYEIYMKSVRGTFLSKRANFKTKLRLGVMDW